MPAWVMKASACRRIAICGIHGCSSKLPGTAPIEAGVTLRPVFSRVCPVRCGWRAAWSTRSRSPHRPQVLAGVRDALGGGVDVACSAAGLAHEDDWVHVMDLGQLRYGAAPQHDRLVPPGTWAGTFGKHDHEAGRTRHGHSGWRRSASRVLRCTPGSRSFGQQDTQPDPHA
jgi:hypothetical protein